MSTIKKPKEIVALEKALHITLEETKNLDDLKDWGKSNHYVLNSEQEVIGLALRGKNFTEIPDLEDFTQLQTLDLSRNQLTEIPKLEKLTQLQRLDLSRNQLTEIPKLEKLTQLQRLDLSGNQLTEITNLEKLTQLQSLELSWNKLTEITHLEKLSQLQTLYLGGNKLTEITNLENLTQLQHLDLSANQITEITNLENLTQLLHLALRVNQLTEITHLENLTQLQHLALSENKLTEITNLENLTQLQRLELRGNQLTEITNLENLTQLQSLELRGNQLTEITHLENLTQLQYLDLSSNQLTEITNLENLTQLQRLELRGNQLTEIPNLENLTQLQHLDLSWNKFTEITHLENLTQLQHLHLSYNQITEITNLENLTQLQVLNLCSNQLKKITHLENLTQLHHLDLSRNQLTTITNLENLTELQFLNLRYNQIIQISHLDQLTQLHHLDLSYNQITEITNLKNLTQLQRLTLSRNQLTELKKLSMINDLEQLTHLTIHDNPFVHEKGLDLRPSENHLDTIQNEVLKLDEETISIQLPVKVMLLGNHASGKSTLLSLLQNRKPKPDSNSTHVLSVEHSHKKINETTLPKAIFYDFGGQDYYHGIYQAFFTQKALNLLVWNPESNHNNLLPKDSEGYSIRNYNRAYWLAQLRYAFTKRNTNSEDYKDPVLLIQTHADQKPNKQNWKEAFKTYNIKDEFHVSLRAVDSEANTKNESVLTYLSATFWETVDELSEQEDKPTWYFNFLQYIINENDEKAIPLDDIIKKVQRKGITNQDKKKFLKADLEQLARSGMLLYYSNDADLQEVAWLNPAKTVEDIHTNLLKKEHLKKYKGRLTSKEFKKLKRKSKLDPKIERLLLNEKVLFYDKPNSEYIIPNYLPLTSEDEEVYDLLTFDFNTPTFVLKFERFIPFGLINQLICHFGQNPDKKHYWRDQLIFTFNTTVKVWIRLDFSRLTISVSIRPKKENKVAMNECIQEIFLTILLLYWGSDIPAPEGTKQHRRGIEEKEALKNIGTFRAEPQNRLDLLKEYLKNYKTPEDLYLSVDGTYFVHSNTLNDSEKTKESITAYKLSDNDRDLDKKQAQTQRSYLYRNFTDNKKIKQMKKIFISYSRKDVEYKDELRKYLNMLTLFDIADTWSCEDIKIGTWHDQIQKELEESDLVIFMLSINFFDSKYILDEEVVKTMDQIAKGSEKKVYCIVVSSFPGLHHFNKEEATDDQKKILELSSYQYGMYARSENLLTGNKEEKIISLKEASKQGMLEDQLTKITEKIYLDITNDR